MNFASRTCHTLTILTLPPAVSPIPFPIQVVATLPVNTSSKVSHMYELCLEKVLQASYPNKTIRLHCITEPEAAFLRFFHTSRPLREALSSSQGKAYFIVIDIGHGTVDQVSGFERLRKENGMEQSGGKAVPTSELQSG